MFVANEIEKLRPKLDISPSLKTEDDYIKALEAWFNATFSERMKNEHRIDT